MIPLSQSEHDGTFDLGTRKADVSYLTTFRPTPALD
jgi:hypothetical protein